MYTVMSALRGENCVIVMFGLCLTSDVTSTECDVQFSIL